MKFFQLLLAGVTVIFTYVNTLAQTLPSNQRPSRGIERVAAFKKQLATIQVSPYKRLQWRNVGPDNISGRCTDVWGIAGKPEIIYATFATGGLWKTEDGGKNWKSLFDQYGTLSIGNMAIAPSNADILYVGTGEANIFRASLPGIGMFKSVDAGKTWQHIGLENTSTIARVVVHPTNPNIVYVAAGGNEWSYNTDRGVYQTTDGGKTWKKILYKDEKTGCIDLRMDPSDPNTIYASMWNRIRKRWSDPVPEDGDYIYKTTDGGKTWKPLTNGLPDTKRTGRIGLAISPSNTSVVYAFVDNHESKRDIKEGELDPYGRPREFVAKGVEVYRSNDKGESWTKMSENDDFMEGICGTYGWVFGQIRVNPLNENTVYIMGVPMGKSTDGGRTWKAFRPDRNANSDRIHGDNHAMWIDPLDTNRIINGNDGGVIVTYDGGKTWKNFFKEIPTTQFYNITYDNSTPYNIIGSVQDELSFMASIKNTYGVKDSTIRQWRRAPGGEGVIHVVDPVDGNIVYTSTFYGRLIKANLKEPDSTWSRDIAPKKTQDEETHRGEWLAYTMLSPFDRFTVYHGMQYLFRSTDSGANWTRISPDLSYNNKNKMGKTPYAINHQAITAVDESPLASGLLYAGTDDGRVWRSPKEGEDWIEITKGLPKNVHVSRLVASQYKESRIYVTLSDRREDNITPYIFVSEDYGKTWANIALTLPPAPVNVVREDPRNPNVLYCGTDMGVYVSKNRGVSWQSLQCNLPLTVSVQDLFVHPRDNNLVIATYGRGIWALDNIEALRK
ncbi:MAG TPA: hypothetical protein VFN30_01855 [Chitinophagaceae bacterium]|nr:hypothetical protein [Chitinophagaceae bacterium]